MRACGSDTSTSFTQLLHGDIISMNGAFLCILSHAQDLLIFSGEATNCIGINSLLWATPTAFECCAFHEALRGPMEVSPPWRAIYRGDPDAWRLILTYGALNGWKTPFTVVRAPQD